MSVRFHCRRAVPRLEPPPSAQIRQWRGSMWAYRVFPACMPRQVRMVFTANAAVPWSVPTDTHPMFGAHVVDPVRVGRAQRGVEEDRGP